MDIQTNQQTPADGLVQIVDGQTMARSTAIATHFGKQHKNVLRAIRNMECSDEFSRLNFEPREYLDARGKTQYSYDITKNGFAFLVMGFTGPQAAAWKERYIDAFDRMHSHLSGESAHNQWELRDRRIQVMQQITQDPRPAFRDTLHADLACICAALGAPTPALDQLAYEPTSDNELMKAKHRPLGVKFWQVVREISRQHLPVNHSRAAGICALHLPSIRALARERGYKLGSQKQLKYGLSALDTPEFIATNSSTNSRITGRTVRCWLFSTDEFDEAPRQAGLH